MPSSNRPTWKKNYRYISRYDLNLITILCIKSKKKILFSHLKVVIKKIHQSFKIQLKQIQYFLKQIRTVNIKKNFKYQTKNSEFNFRRFLTISDIFSDYVSFDTNVRQTFNFIHSQECVNKAVSTAIMNVIHPER